MDQHSGTSGQGSEDTSRAREHVHNAEENRDALAAQHRRTESTTPSGVDTPAGGSDVRGDDVGGNPGSMGATGSRPSDDASQARDNVRAAEDNRDALADENRRVESTLPPDVDTGR